ncbi:MAG TPA: hypothetical protein EYP88_06490, partial [Anaerolineales bacterium]|nr:hypothetical protein [Anaerolineales bacterium]
MPFSFLNRARNITASLVRHGLHQDDAQRFQNFIRTANDRELYRVNPRYLAQQLRWTEKQTLDVLAISTAEGIWQLEWDSHCAACGALVQQTGALADLHSHQHCPACGADGEINQRENLAEEDCLRLKVGLHALSSEAGRDVWWVRRRSTGGITP